VNYELQLNYQCFHYFFIPSLAQVISYLQKDYCNTLAFLCCIDYQQFSWTEFCQYRHCFFFVVLTINNFHEHNFANINVVSWRAHKEMFQQTTIYVQFSLQKSLNKYNLLAFQVCIMWFSHNTNLKCQQMFLLSKEGVKCKMCFKWVCVVV